MWSWLWLACADPCARDGWLDRDGDGYGGRRWLGAACGAEGLALRAGDCRDDDPQRHPGAVEACNGLDDDCDGQVDQGLPLRTFYRDEDGDGWGTSSTAVTTCGPFSGTVPRDGDCDDADAQRFPGASEPCGGAVDLDCDGRVASCPLDPLALSGPRALAAEGEGPLGLAAGDVDGDGRTDLVLHRGELLLASAAQGPFLPWLGAADRLGPRAGRLPGAAEEALLWVQGDRLERVSATAQVELLRAEAGALLGFALDYRLDGHFLVGLPGTNELRWGQEATVGRRTGTSALGLAVAWVDLDGDGLEEVVAGQGGAGCRVVWTEADDRDVPLEAGRQCWWDDLPYDEVITLTGADLDGDGLAEVVAGLPGRDQGAGELVALAGAPRGRAAWSSARAAWFGGSGRRLGQAVAPFDVEGDGRDELALGVREQGRSRVVLAVDPLSSHDLLASGWWLPGTEEASAGEVLATWAVPGRRHLAAASAAGPVLVWSTE